MGRGFESLLRYHQKSALIAGVARAHPEAERLEVWFLDEARVGQTGRLCRRWYQCGLRPRDVRDLRHQAAYLFGAVPSGMPASPWSCPESAPPPCR
jgi:hypothetical protein